MAVFQFACKKNNSGGTPVITHVRTVSPAEADSFFTQALPGALIVIQGSGFSGLEAVYFNDSAAAVNPVYVTSTNIIVSIPSGTQTLATDPKVPNLIKVVTNHGTATFTFKVVLDPPAIANISFDNTGTILYINGLNLVGISKITFPIGATGNYDTATGYTINTTWTQIAAGVPPGTAWPDSIRVYTTFGVASYPFPPPMTIASISNENAVAGSKITINGINFIGVQSVIFPGNISVPPTSNGAGQMSVVVPPGITAPDSLRISGQLGMATAPQLFDSYITFPSPGYITTFEGDGAGDNTGFVGWTGGFASSSQATTAYPGNTGAVGVLNQGSPMGANAGTYSQANATTVTTNDVPWVSSPSTTSIAGYSLKFELYVASPWKAGEIWILVGDWFKWTSYSYRYAPWDTTASGVYSPTGWTTVTIPLTQLLSVPVGGTGPYTGINPNGLPAVHFSDYPYTSLGFMMTNDQSAGIPAGSINLAIDNVRIVKGQ
jgi:hypothetical protein